MPRAYPKELRERVVQAWEDGEGSFKILGKRFKVGEATVDRWVALKRETGSVEPRKAGGARRAYKVDAVGEQFIRETLEALPDSTHPELCAAYLEVFDVVISPQTMSDTVRRLGYTRKRGPTAEWQLNGPTS